MPVAWLTALVAMVGGVAPAAESREAAVPIAATPLVADVQAMGNLTVSANGQTVYLIDEMRRAIVSVDPFDPTRRRDVVAAAPGEPSVPVAIGCLPGDILAAVCRDGDEWDLRTYRLRPGEPAAAAHPQERVPLGRAAGDAGGVIVAVSRSRDWLAITGLPHPLPPVVRGVFAGAGVRLLPTEESVAGGFRPRAATVSPADELVLLEAVDDGPARLSFLAPSGRPLLRLDTGLANVRGAAFGRQDGRLWVVAGPAAAQPPGLWRLDATMQGGGQVVRATRAEVPADPLAIIDVPGASLVVVEGGSPRSLLRLDIREANTR
jgi:hypothetical protein